MGNKSSKRCVCRDTFPTQCKFGKKAVHFCSCDVISSSEFCKAKEHVCVCRLGRYFCKYSCIALKHECTCYLHYCTHLPRIRGGCTSATHQCICYVKHHPDHEHKCPAGKCTVHCLSVTHHCICNVNPYECLVDGAQPHFCACWKDSSICKVTYSEGHICICMEGGRCLKHLPDYNK